MSALRSGGASRAARRRIHAPRLWATLLVVLLACSVFAQDLPPAPERYATDRAGVLTPKELDLLERELTRLEKEGLAQAIIYIDRRVPASQPSLEDYTLRLVNAWGVGDSERNDGVAIFVFIEDRRMRIEVGLGLEEILTDDVARKILDEEMRPAFREGKFGTGLTRALAAMERALRAGQMR